MSIQEIGSTIKELRELRRMREELEAEITTLEDSIKLDMAARGVDTLTTADAKITWKEIASSRIDTTAIKKELPDIAARYTKTSMTRRFILA